MVKKKSIIISGIVIILVVLSIFLSTRPDVLGNMNKTFAEPTTSTSNISFAGEENNKIKFSFRSNVESGELNIVLYDSNGNLVYELDKAKALETYFTFDKTDTYTLKAEYVDFVGNYEIAVYKEE